MNRFPGPLVCALCAFLLTGALACFAGAWFAHDAAAANPDGIFAEDTIHLGDVSVKRVRDTHDHVVCYVARGYLEGTGYNSSSGSTVAISCLRQVP